MARYEFFGRVLPEIRKTTSPKAFTLTYGVPPSFSAEFDIHIREAKVTVACNTHGEGEDDFSMAMVRSLELTTAIVDAIGFARGEALHVIIDQGLRGDEIGPVVLSEKSVERLCTAYSLESGFEEVCEELLGEVELRFAFRDLVSSLSTLNYCAIAGARAVEAIRHLIAPNLSSEVSAWQKMRELLNIDKEYLREITQASRAPRHGQRAISDLGIQKMVTHRAWTIMDRYLHFRRRGGVLRLPESEFPLLT